MKQIPRWRWHYRSWAYRHEYQTPAWARWWVGLHCGWFGLAVVRETWGWRFVLGPWQLCGHLE